MEMPEDLKNFLLKNDALDTFLKNSPVINDYPTFYIACAFRWNDSQEGGAYWGRIHDKWQAHLKNTH